MKKTIAGIIAGLVLVGVVLFRFYLAVQNEEWDSHALASQTVTQSTYIKQVTRVETFRGELPYTIVFGLDEAGQEGVAWVGEQPEDVHMEYLGNGGGMTEAAIREIVKQRGADVEIERILPGKLDDELVWEVFYKRKEEGGSRFYYDYYRFMDGTEIDTWKLSK
jgi:uncharacterized protein YpmB